MRARAASVAVLMVVGIACDDSSSRSSSPAPTPAAKPPAPAAVDSAGGGAGGETAEAGSSARATWLAFAQAVVAGDRKAAKALVVGDATGFQGLEVMMDFAASDAKWQAALQAQFGQTAPKPFAGVYTSDPESATEEVNGDTSIIKRPHERSGTQLLRQKDGTWKVNMNYDPNGGAAGAIETMRLLARVNNEMAAEVAAGKHPSLPAALQAHAAKRVAAQPNAGSSPAAPASPGNAAAEGDGLE